MTEFSELKTKIEQTITDESTPLWFPNLTKDLVDFGWEKLEKERQIGLESYSTNHLLLPNSNATREIIAKLPKNNESTATNDVIQLEILSPEITSIYKKQGAEFYEKSEILNSSIMETLSEAISIIQKVPSLNDSVFDLVRVLHLIKSDEAGEYDISFSEPHIPFSIFFSVPQKRVFADFLRVAEAIIHEAMHLQLTLIENNVTLIIESDNEYFSPWKNQTRKANGVMHALYVFKVIDIFLKILLQNVQSSKFKDYIINRRKTIFQQILEIGDFGNVEDLTIIGKTFVDILIKSYYSQNTHLKNL